MWNKPFKAKREDPYSFFFYRFFIILFYLYGIFIVIKVNV